MQQYRLRDTNVKSISILVPVFNESKVLPIFFERIEPLLKKLAYHTELLFVDDGSTDNSCNLINNRKSISDKRKLIKLSRNFGKEAALCAGLNAATGDAVIIIDVDLQDPPELIIDMVEAWEAGADVVNMKRTIREGESWFKLVCAKGFYKLLNKLSDTYIPENVGDFRLIARNVVDVINAMPERNIYMKGIFSWPGFNTTTINFNRCARRAGESKWPFLKLVKLALDGITSFSTKPLQIATWSGGLLALASFLYGMFVFMKTMLWGEVVTGYPTLMITVLALGGFQLLTVGIMGAYIGRIYSEVQNRPRYVIEEEVQHHNRPAQVQSLSKKRVNT